MNSSDQWAVQSVPSQVHVSRGETSDDVTPASAYDPLRHRVVVFGGVTSSLVSPRDTWTWDGTDWTAH